MLAKTPIQTLFYDYVAGRDPNDRYEWASFQRCACAQFLREENIELDGKLYQVVWGIGQGMPSLTDFSGAAAGSLNAIAYGDGTPDDWNFGALRRRLEAAGHGPA